MKLNKSLTAGLETDLKIGINSNVMLVRNLDTSIGLVNGAIGHVVKLNFNNEMNTQVNTIIVKFEHIDEPIVLERFLADFEVSNGNYVTRAQFPLTLAWAITIHKCQGLSLQTIILDIGPDIFEGGMAYVGLSRARLLKNVHLIEFDPNVLYCCKEAIEEYLKLYNKNNLQPLVPTNYNILPQKAKSNCEKSKNPPKH